MSLHKEARFFLVAFTQPFACFTASVNRVSRSSCLGDANTIRTLAAEIRQVVGKDRRQAIHRPCQHQRKAYISRNPPGPPDHRWGKRFRANIITQAMNDVGVTVEVGEAINGGASALSIQYFSIQISAFSHNTSITSRVITQHTRKHN